MKTNLLAIFAYCMLVIFSACQKDDKDDFKATANLIVINSSIDNGGVKVNPGAGAGFAYSSAFEIGYASSGVFGAFVGSSNVTIVSAADTTKTIFSRNLNLTSINTLYLAGQTPTVDTIFKSESNLPYIQATKLNPDSSVFVRFVNLSPNCPPVSITIDSATTNEFGNIAYKGVSGFKKYAALKNDGDYVFNVRNAATNDILTSVTFSRSGNRFKTLSIIISGLVDDETNPLGTFQVNYFN